MLSVGNRIEESGTLIFSDNAILLRRNSGRAMKLDLHRIRTVPALSRVRVSGTIVADGLIDVDNLIAHSESA